MSRPEVDSVTFGATVDVEGKLHPENASVIRVRLGKKWKEKRVLVVVSAWRKPKTQPQLGYYYDVVLPILAEFIGDDEDSVHKDCKRSFFPKRREVSKITGDETEEVPSLADASSEEMSEYLDRIIRFFAGHKVTIPPPHAGPEWDSL